MFYFNLLNIHYDLFLVIYLRVVSELPTKIVIKRFQIYRQRERELLSVLIMNIK